MHVSCAVPTLARLPAVTAASSSTARPQAASRHASLATSCSSARAPPRQRRRRLAVAAAAAAREQWQLQDSDGEDGEDQEDERWPSQLRASTSYNAAEADGADESRAFAIAMAQMAWETKAEDVMVLHVAPVVYWTRYMLLATVFSRPQLNAILGKMTKEAAEVHGRRLSQTPQGNSGGWELLDYGDVVVHILTADQREYYDLESFYSAAEAVPLPFDTKQPASSGTDSWTKRL